MISPRSPLLFLAAAVFVPAIAIFFAGLGLTSVAALVLLCFVLIVTIDALFLQPDFSSLRALFPDVVRLSKGREGNIEIKCLSEKPIHVCIGLPFPPEIGAKRNELKFHLSPQTRAQVATVLCEPMRRGRFLLQKIYVRAPTRLRLWNVRRALPVQCEVRVYPDLLTERHNISALFLRRGMFGFRRHRQIGKGREFEKLREYIPGDGMEDVHWKATAKRGHPVTKIFQIERTQEVYVLVDSSRLSARTSGATPMLERFINAALVLCLAAAKQSDLFGLVTFSDKVHTFVRAKNGKAHYNFCRDALYTLQPKVVSPDFEDLFTLLRLRLRRRALLVFFTALDDPALAENFVQHVELLTRQHLVLVNMIQSAESRPLFARDDVTQPDQIYQRLAGHLAWAELQEIRKRLHRFGVEFSLVPAERLAADAVDRYLRVKQRQLL